jgi:hypothetical protein
LGIIGNSADLIAGNTGEGAAIVSRHSSISAPPAVNARDRIGKGPWQNSKGVVIAKDVAELHGTNNLDALGKARRTRRPAFDRCLRLERMISSIVNPARQRAVTPR